MYPDDCLQSCAESWWVKDESRSLVRGRLIWSFLPHVDQQPLILIPEDRGEDPTNHKNPIYRIADMDVRRPPLPPRLPVAGLPNFHEETKTVYRAKKRPALVLCDGGEKIAKRLVGRGGSWLGKQTVVVAPYYGADQSGKRAGVNPAFLARVRLANYPQFMWESLPLPSLTSDSILRLDHIQPVGRSRDNIQCTEWMLSPEALVYLDDWLRWLLSELPEPADDLKAARDILHEIFGSDPT